MNAYITSAYSATYVNIYKIIYIHRNIFFFNIYNFYISLKSGHHLFLLSCDKNDKYFINFSWTLIKKRGGTVKLSYGLNTWNEQNFHMHTADKTCILRPPNFYILPKGSAQTNDIMSGQRTFPLRWGGGKSLFLLENISFFRGKKCLKYEKLILNT